MRKFDAKGERPEFEVGGYARDCSTVDFYLRLGSIIKPHHKVLDFGAGRGASHDLVLQNHTLGKLVNLKNSCAELVAADIDPIVKDNQMCHRSVLLDNLQRYPFESNEFDVIFCDWVLEHIEWPSAFSKEIKRILKPGGWFLARTPNKWGYIGLSSRLLPSKAQDKALKFVQPHRMEADVFKKYYRINTKRDIESAFDKPDWKSFTYPLNATPAYHGGSRVIYAATEHFQKFAPRAMATLWIVCMRNEKNVV